MTTVEQLKTLTEKLVVLEDQLKAASGSTAAGGSGSSPGEVTVMVQGERRLRKFLRVRDDHLIEDWILDAKRVISSQSVADAVDNLLYHLEGGSQGGVATPTGRGEKHPRSCIPGTTALIW